MYEAKGEGAGLQLVHLCTVPVSSAPLGLDVQTGKTGETLWVLTEDDNLHHLAVTSRTEWKFEFSNSVSSLCGDKWKTEGEKDLKVLSFKIYEKMLTEKTPKSQDEKQPKKKRRKRLGGKNQSK